MHATDAAPTDAPRSCACCGLIQLVPTPPPGHAVRCARCHARFRSTGNTLRSNRRAAALALSALILYPLAIGLPIMRIEQFGHARDTSVLDGTLTLLAHGHLFAGAIVLLCSLVAPLAKLLGILVLAGGVRLQHAHRALTYRIVEFTGRWGMLDVLLVALLVAVLKLGDFVEVTAGPAAFAFAAVVTLSLVATACFDPHALWNEPATPRETPG